MSTRRKTSCWKRRLNCWNWARRRSRPFSNKWCKTSNCTGKMPLMSKTRSRLAGARPAPSTVEPLPSIVSSPVMSRSPLAAVSAHPATIRIGPGTFTLAVETELYGGSSKGLRVIGAGREQTVLSAITTSAAMPTQT